MNKEFVARRGVISLGGLTFPYYSTDSNYTASTDDYFIDITTSGVTVELPSSSGITGKQYAIRNTSTGNTTIEAYSGQTIEGDLTVTLGVGNTLQLVSDNSNWKILNVGGPIRTATNNSLLTSDGTIGGVDANTGLTFDGQTLKIQGQTSATTAVETYAYTLDQVFTATTAYSINNAVFKYPLEKVISFDIDYEITKNNGGKRTGAFRRLASQTATTTFGSSSFSFGGVINTTPTPTGDTTHLYVILRSTGTEVITSTTLSARIIKYI